MSTVERETISVQFAGQLGQFSLDIDFACPLRGITALFGPSGCGKTTVLRFIAGLQRMSGALHVGMDCWQNEQGKFITPHQRSIGYVFQEPSLFPHLSVKKTLEYGFKRIAPTSRRVEFDEAVELLGIARLLSRSPDQLSGGQRQRVGIARALLTSPTLLLMDEPLASLDAQSKQEILPYIERLNAELGMPVLYVSHSSDEVSRLADHLVLLADGRVRASGKLTELYARLDIAREQGSDATSIVETHVAEHDETFQLTALEFSGGQFRVVRNHYALGTRVRLRVRASDVSLTLEQQTGTSILNIFRAQVDTLQACGDSQTLVRLNLAGTFLLARITRKSCHDLGLLPGQWVYAQIKAAGLVE